MASEHLQQAVTLLQLEGVYEIATRVSEEFQELASQFGGSRLATIIPIVLDALEHLERAVTANQQLEIKVRRLILSNDALKREKEETSTELKEHNQLKVGLKDEQRERIRLTEEVGRLRKRNESLIRKIDQIKIETESLQTSPLHTVIEESKIDGIDRSYTSPSSLNRGTASQTPTVCGDFSLNGDGAGDCLDDVMTLSRIKKRLTLVESELDLTKHKFSTTQASLQTLLSENGALRSQVEQYKAELSLKRFESSRGTEMCCTHCQSGTRENDEKSPKYFKEDLLRVLTERNELKEQIDSLRDELSLAQAELRKSQNHGHSFSRLKRRSRSKTPPARQRSATRVREIFDSIRIEEYAVIEKK